MLKSVIQTWWKDAEKNQALVQVELVWERGIRLDQDWPDFQVEVLGTMLKAYRTRVSHGQIWRVTQDGKTIRERVGDGEVFVHPFQMVVPLDKLEAYQAAQAA